MYELVIIETGHIDARFKHEDFFTLQETDTRFGILHQSHHQAKLSQ